MQVADGYKLTEVGVIPENWRCVASDECVQYFGGNAFSSKSQAESGVRWLKIANVGVHNTRWDDVTYLPKEFVKQFPAFKLSEGDIVMALTRPILSGRLKVARLGARDVPALLNQRVARIIPSEDCNLKYIYQTLQLPYFVDCMNVAMAGTDPPNIGSGALGKIPIAVPPLPEQWAIAEALSDVDALIQSLDALITKKRHIKQGTMQQLLTGKKRLPGFSGEWEEKTFGQLFNFSGGYSASREQLSSEGHCYLHYGDIHGTTKTYVDTDEDFPSIPKLDIPLKDVSSVSLLDDGDVVFVDASEDVDGASRHVVIVNMKSKPFISGLHTIVAKSKADDLVNSFKRFCFQTSAIKEQFLFYAVGTKVTGISKSNIPKLVLPVPAREEQAAIAEVLSDMDAEIEALEQKRDKTKLIKQGMMQELLTGKTRLV